MFDKMLVLVSSTHPHSAHSPPNGREYVEGEEVLVQHSKRGQIWNQVPYVIFQVLLAQVPLSDDIVELQRDSRLIYADGRANLRE